MSSQSVNCKQFTTFPCLAHKFVAEMFPLLDPSNFRDNYLRTEILSKYIGVGTTPLDVLEQRAYSAVFESEKRNVKTNVRIESFRRSEESLLNRCLPSPRVGNMSLRAVINTARELISNTIGDYTYDVVSQGRFTSGAAVGYSRNHGDRWYKYQGRVTCTAVSAKSVLAFILQHPGWVRLLSQRYGDDPYKWIKIVKGNKGFTVRKNSEEDRFACKEPTGNMLLQTGIGMHFRQRLLRVGIDLNDQSYNRRAAFHGSRTDGDSTIDLRKASDSVTVALVRLLFSESWFRAMLLARSPEGMIDGKPHRWEMISSMGNGYTFELESLIFWALAEAVRRISLTPGKVLVYGDDIVVPQQTTHRVIAVLGWAGFRTNPAKTFVRGPFRESCGGHYYKGLDVTPFYIRKPITDTSRVIWLLNALRKWCNVGGICDDRFSQLYKRWRRKYVDMSLWGGKRLGSISSLVTPCAPKGRLRFIMDSRRIDGPAAVLRTFSFQRQSEYNYRRDVKYLLPGQDEPSLDPQAHWEMYGSIPITSDMSRICVISPVVGFQADYIEHYPDSFGLWPFEI